MEFLRKIVKQIHKESKDVDYPNEFSLEQCISELIGDGFTVSSALRDDVARFGLVEGTVLAMDGSCGLRVVNWNGEGLVIKTFNGLYDGKDPLSKLAKAKYDLKPISLEVSPIVAEVSETSSDSIPEEKPESTATLD